MATRKFSEFMNNLEVITYPALIVSAEAPPAMMREQIKSIGFDKEHIENSVCPITTQINERK